MNIVWNTHTVRLLLDFTFLLLFRWTLLADFSQLHPDRQISGPLFSQVDFEMFSLQSPEKKLLYRNKAAFPNPLFDQCLPKSSNKQAKTNKQKLLLIRVCKETEK